MFDIVGEDAGFFDVPYKSLGNDGGSIKVCEFDEMTVMKGNGKLIYIMCWWEEHRIVYLRTMHMI